MARWWRSAWVEPQHCKVTVIVVMKSRALWRSPGVERSPGVHEALGSIPGTGLVGEVVEMLSSSVQPTSHIRTSFPDHRHVYLQHCH